MGTYLFINIIFLAIIAVAIFIWPVGLSAKRLLLVIAVLLILTAVFDNIIIALDIVAYEQFKILGVYLGKAPIEDFAYAIAAAILVPYLWELCKDKDIG